MRREIPQKVDAQFNFAGWSRSTSVVRFGATLFRRTRSASVLSITLTATALGFMLPQPNATAHLALIPNILGNLTTPPVKGEGTPTPQGDTMPSLTVANGNELFGSSPLQSTVWQVQETSDPQSPSAFSTTPNVLMALKGGAKPGLMLASGSSTDLGNAMVVAGTGASPRIATVATPEGEISLPPAEALPPKTGAFVHTVEKGENLTEIADKYRVSTDLIAQANRISNPNVIDINEGLVIPPAADLATVTRPVIAAAQADPRLVASSLQDPQIARRSVFPQIPPLDLPSLNSAEPFLPSMLRNGVQRFIWPAQGVFTSGYGWRWGRMHRGIDIAAPIGTPVVAAAAGVVISAGWNDGGYGNLVEIRHPDGAVTVYAHNQAIKTRVGAVVNQGEMIALMGSTGRSTGPHSHFEIHPSGRGAVNPLILLSRQPS